MERTICTDSGITFEGKPLSDVLEAQESSAKGKEIARERREDMNEKSKLIYHESRDRLGEETRRVSRRVICLSDRQIRKEYGVMAKPYKTIAENIIAVIMEKGPVNSGRINNILNKESKQTSSIISYIYQALSPKYLDRGMQIDGKSYSYKFIKEISVADAHIKYKYFMRNLLKPSPSLSPKRGEGYKRKISDAGKRGSAAGKGLQAIVGEVLTRELGVNVKVEGEIIISVRFLP
ncbi:MAG: hypothetical protein KAQ85_01665 [Thermodesulfovibrionia bacterium]|nr:hypothetical protein [Thermodesulfovibrionia bacterium]